jgi:biotin transport system ATP-binding protein
MALIELHGVVVDVPVDVPEQGPTRRRLLGPLDVTLCEHRVTVIGANGSGKSTLLRQLNGLVLPSSGHVTVGGHDTREDGPAVRRTVAFAFTDPLSQLVMPTGREDVELSLRRVHRSRAERRGAAAAVLDRFGLTHLADQSIYDLSGGERQLMALAAVLATEPEVLVLDEPSTLLDLRNTRLLRRTVAGLDQAVVMATHDLDLALDADRTLVVHAGTLAFDGPPVEAVAHYRSLSAELP